MVIAEKKKAVLLVIFIAVILAFVVFGASKENAPFNSMRVNSPEDAAEFLSTLGWECDLMNASVQETFIPKQFDDTFIGYNRIQMEQGCDLTRYAGKTVTVFTVPITNYTGFDGHVLATLIIYRSTVVGGDIHSAEMDGFMHTLK